MHRGTVTMSIGPGVSNTFETSPRAPKNIYRVRGYGEGVIQVESYRQVKLHIKDKTASLSLISWSLLGTVLLKGFSNT